MVLPEGETDSLTVYPAKKGSALVGFAIESYTQKGFSGLIRVMVGFDAEGRLVDFSVLQHSESPGSARVSPSGTTRRVRRAAYVDVRGLDMRPRLRSLSQRTVVR